MKIHRLMVKNFRGFAERTLLNFNDPHVSGAQSFSFSDQFNVLIGDNGTGKTAVLDALAVGLGTIFIGLDGTQARSILPEEVRFARYQLHQTVTEERLFPVVIESEGMLNGQRLRWTRTLDRLEGRTTRQYAQDIVSVARKMQDQVRNNEPVVLPLIAYYGTGRLWLQKKEKADPFGPGSRTDGYIDCLAPASSEKVMMRWLKRMELIALQRGATLDVLEAVKQAVSTCVETWKTISFDLNADELMVQADDKRVLPFRLLSDGVRNMVAMVADMAYRAAVLNPQLGLEAARQTPGVVLIDEIDLHLHPNWQRRVVEDLRRTFPEVQFISTTHSPFIIQSLRPGELINLNGTEPAEYADKSIEDIAEQVMEVPIPQRSERYLDMMEAAKEYYRVLQEAQSVDEVRKEQLKSRLDELVAPFSDDIAYHAFLQMKREMAGLGENGHAPS